MHCRHVATGEMVCAVQGSELEDGAVEMMADGRWPMAMAMAAAWARRAITACSGGRVMKDAFTMSGLTPAQGIQPPVGVIETTQPSRWAASTDMVRAKRAPSRVSIEAIGVAPAGGGFLRGYTAVSSVPPPAAMPGPSRKACASTCLAHWRS
jgi:hypothetical protein